MHLVAFPLLGIDYSGAVILNQGKNKTKHHSLYFKLCFRPQGSNKKTSQLRSAIEKMSAAYLEPISVIQTIGLTLKIFLPGLSLNTSRTALSESPHLLQGCHCGVSGKGCNQCPMCPAKIHCFLRLFTCNQPIK